MRVKVPSKILLSFIIAHKMEAFMVMAFPFEDIAKLINGNWSIWPFTILTIVIIVEIFHCNDISVLMTRLSSVKVKDNRVEFNQSNIIRI